MAKKSVSELEKRTVNAMMSFIACHPGIETKLLRGYLALQLLTENGRLPYSFKGARLTKLPTARQIIAMLRRNRRVYWTNKNPFFLRWYVKPCRQRWTTVQFPPRAIGNSPVDAVLPFVDPTHC